ncbi:hypothetical protein Ancab_029410 [Ancistrocladus abbreviatus]
MRKVSWPIGGNMVLIKPSRDANLETMETDSSIKLARVVWIGCLGIPLHAWTEEVFKKSAKRWGDLTAIDVDTKVDEDEFSIYKAEEALFPIERSGVNWGDSKGSFDESSEVVLPFTASISMVPEFVGEDIVVSKLPVVAPSQEPNPKVHNLNLRINMLVSKAQEEPTRNDEVESEQFEFHRLSRGNVCRMDGGEKLIASGAEVDNQRYDMALIQQILDDGLFLRSPGLV